MSQPDNGPVQLAPTVNSFVPQHGGTGDVYKGYGGTHITRVNDDLHSTTSIRPLDKDCPINDLSNKSLSVHINLHDY